MCRHYAFLANERTKVECTLVHAQNALLTQSQRDMRGAAHADGWGIAVYHNRHPEVEKRATAAFEDMHFNTTAARLYSKAVIAHVRKATVGGPSLANTHPFVHACWSFSHNGTVSGFESLQEELIQETDPCFRPNRLGTSDSEQVFYWLLTRMRAGGIDATRRCDNVSNLVSVVASCTNELVQRSEQVNGGEPSRLNFLLTDGHVLLATRWKNSLYWTYHAGLDDCEYCGVPHVEHRPGIEFRAVVVASEPISNEPWHEIPNHTILAVGPDVRPRVQTIEKAVCRV